MLKFAHPGAVLTCLSSMGFEDMDVYLIGVIELTTLSSRAPADLGCVLSVVTSGRQISEILVVTNPDKLAHISIRS